MGFELCRQSPDIQDWRFLGNPLDDRGGFDVQAHGVWIQSRGCSAENGAECSFIRAAFPDPQTAQAWDATQWVFGACTVVLYSYAINYVCLCNRIGVIDRSRNVSNGASE